MSSVCLNKKRPRSSHCRACAYLFNPECHIFCSENFFDSVKKPKQKKKSKPVKMFLFMVGIINVEVLIGNS